MGADLLIACFWEPIDKNFKPDWKKGHDWVDEQAKDWAKNETLPNEIDWMSSPEEAADNLHNYLKTVQEAYEGQHKELTNFEFPPYLIWLTCGMSWGDTPTDIFQPISTLNDLGLFELMGFNSVPDYQKIASDILAQPSLRPLLLGLNPELDVLLEKKLKRGGKK